MVLCPCGEEMIQWSEILETCPNCGEYNYAIGDDGQSDIWIGVEPDSDDDFEQMIEFDGMVDRICFLLDLEF